MIIVTKNKAYRWNYKRFVKNLIYAIGVACFFWAYFYLSHLDYLDAIK